MTGCTYPQRHSDALWPAVRWNHNTELHCITNECCVGANYSAFVCDVFTSWPSVTQVNAFCAKSKYRDCRTDPRWLASVDDVMLRCCIYRRFGKLDSTCMSTPSMHVLYVYVPALASTTVTSYWSKSAGTLSYKYQFGNELYNFLLFHFSVKQINDLTRYMNLTAQ